jgi:anoctamin-1
LLQEYSALFFQDNVKTVDFVLVWDNRNLISATDTSQQKREIFERNLLDEGLDLEIERAEAGSALTFIKIHAPIEVLRRYSEILKLRMPMKEVRLEI